MSWRILATTGRAATDRASAMKAAYRPRPAVPTKEEGVRSANQSHHHQGHQQGSCRNVEGCTAETGDDSQIGLITDDHQHHDHGQPGQCVNG